MERENVIATLYNADYAVVLEQIVLAFNIDTFVVCTMHRHAADLFTVAKAYGIKNVAWLIDWYYLSPTNDLEDGAKDVYDKLEYSRDFLKGWKKRMAALLSEFDSVVSNDKKIIENHVIYNIRFDSSIRPASPLMRKSDKFNPGMIFDSFVKIGDNLLRNRSRNVEEYLQKTRTGNMGYVRLLQNEYSVETGEKFGKIKNTSAYVLLRLIYHKFVKRDW
jgi:hypothetical protein